MNTDTNTNTNINTNTNTNTYTHSNLITHIQNLNNTNEYIDKINELKILIYKSQGIENDFDIINNIDAIQAINNKLDFAFYDAYGFEYNTYNNLQLQNAIARNDYIFKEKVKNYYNNHCCITGRAIDVCEVAHILPFSKCDNDNEKYDDANGLLLCRDLHKLFDDNKMQICINTNTNSDTNTNTHIYVVLFSNDILNNASLSVYTQYHNIQIRNINQLSIKYFNKR